MENYFDSDVQNNRKVRPSNIRRRLFSTDFDPNKNILTGIRPLATPDDDIQANYSKTNEHLFSSEDDFTESDECDYDSDCSLGSMNSLYLNLKKNCKFLHSNETNKAKEEQLKKEINHMNKSDKVQKMNKLTTIRILEKENICDKFKNLNTACFYGKQKSMSRRRYYSRLSFVHQSKNKRMNSIKRKTKSSLCKLKSSIKQICVSLKNRKFKPHLKRQRMSMTGHIIKKDTMLIRNQLKKPIPLLKLNHNIVRKITPLSEKYSQTLTSSEEKCPQNNDMDFTTSCHIIIKRENHSLGYANIEKQLSESCTFLTDDFMDTDDFGGTEEIEKIVQRLFLENDSITENCFYSPWNENGFDDIVEVQDKSKKMISTLSKEVNI